MKICRILSIRSLLFISLLNNVSARLWSSSSIPGNRTNVIEEWKGMEKELKSMTDSIIKYLMPIVMEAPQPINLTSQCAQETFKLVAGLKGLKKWAFQFVDSSAKMMDGTLSGTVSFLGVYKECVETVVPHPRDAQRVLFKGKYCTADIRPPLPPKNKTYRMHDRLEMLSNYSGSEVLKFLTTKAHLYYFQPFKIGLCIPSGCTMNDLSQMLTIVSTRGHLDVEVTHCEIKQPTKFSIVHVAAIAVCCILGSFVLLGTCLEIYINKETYAKGLLIKFFLCFSLITNFKKLMSTKTSEDEAHMKCFHGLQFLSIAWIVIGHSYFFPSWFIRSYKNLFQIQDIAREVLIQMVVNGSEAINSLFFISGCLACYYTVKHVKVGKEKLDLDCFIFRKMWRTIPTYYFVVLFAMLTPLMGSGPLFHETMVESIYPCYHYWWRNLLFINNFFDMSEYCLQHTWYVSCDMQLHFASLLVILPLLRYERIGLIINVAIVALSVAYTGIISALKDLPAMGLMVNLDPEDRSTGPIYSYSNALSRAGPYFIGTFLGYILATKQSLKMPKKVQVIGWCLAILCSGSVVFASAYWYNVHRPSPDEMYAYSALFKVAFTSGVAWMIFCCTTGHGGFINKLLSWNVWIPLSKLSFLVYLIQPILQNSYIANFNSAQEYTHFHFIMQFFGFLCISSLLAMVCNLLVESPFIAMEKLTEPAPKPREEKEMNGHTNIALEDIKAETNGNTDIHWTLETDVNDTYDSKL